MQIEKVELLFALKLIMCYKGIYVKSNTLTIDLSIDESIVRDREVAMQHYPCEGVMMIVAIRARQNGQLIDGISRTARPIIDKMASPHLLTIPGTTL